MAYSRYFTEQGAQAYADKHRGGLLRRLSARREAACLGRALRAAGAGGAILDLPCGAGRFTALLCRFSDPYIAADLSPAMLRIARAAAGPAPGFPALLTDARAAGMRSLSVDGVVAMRLIHHFPDPRERRQILAELARISRRFLVLTFVDRESWKQRMRRRNPARPPRRAAVTRDEIRDDLAAEGFRVAGFFAVSSLFSGQTVAACVRDPARRRTLSLPSFPE